MTFIILVLVFYKTPAYEEKFSFYGYKSCKVVALTFDDGPHPYYTIEIVKVLNKYHIPATFFFVGKQVEKYPEIVRYILENSQCKVANHTYSHKNLSTLSKDEIFNELYATSKVLESINSEKVLKCFRPPGGNFSNEVLEVANRLGLRMVLWSVFTNDHTDISREKLISVINNGCVSDKEIILLHSGKDTTLYSLEEIIRLLYLKGYNFVSVDEIIYNENLSS